jgi:thiol:disulfide interchange protein DsbD
MKIFTRVCLLLGLVFGAHIHAEEFLDPDEAFRFAATAIDARTLEARFDVADGYYLYRQKIKFELTGGKLGNPRLPPGKMKDDENFGKVEIYRKALRIALPIEPNPGTTAVTLKATYQGCADAGLCYTPQTKSVLIKLPAPATARPAPGDAPPAKSAPATPLPRPQVAAVATQSQSADALAGLRSLAGGGDMPRVLPPEEAFKLDAAMPDAQTVVLNYRLAPGTYLYRNKLGLVVSAPAGVTVKTAVTPQPDVKDDPNFGRTEVYHRDFRATYTLSRALAAGETLLAEAAYQGCNETAGICYPPATTPLKLAVAQAAAAKPAAALQAAPPAAESDTSKIERILKGGSFFGVIAAFFGFGLLLALTPCVFPMIPILSSIIAGQTHHTKASGFLLSLAYVLGMAITYALAGVAAALSGTLISNALQNPWALGIGALIFVALALSMFGFYELQLPSSLQSRFSERASKIKGGHFAGVFAMGALSAVIVGPCVAPPLAAALAFIAQTGNTVLGGAALFALALGMGVPLLLVGVSAGALLPRAGAWMNGVKYFFGVLMLAIAIYLISPVIPAWLGMLLWATLLIVSATYLHALDPLPPQASGWKRLWKGIGVVLLIAGGALLAGLAGGSRDVLQPFDVFKVAKQAAASGAAGASHGVAFERVRSVAELDARLAAAKAAGKPVMLDFYADWCVSCKEMERNTFTDPKVAALLSGMVLLQADVTANSDEERALLKRFGLFGPPGMIFWKADGTQSDYKVVGYEPPEKFIASLQAVLGP